MIKNYIRTIFRNFWRRKHYTFINILGLTVGVASCLVIFLLIRYELRFDTFHTQADRIYRVVCDSESAGNMTYNAAVPYPLPNAFRLEFPQIPLVTQVHIERGEALLSVNEEKHLVENVIFADSMFFEVFDFEVLSGNPRRALAQPGQVFLTQSLADQLRREGEEAVLKYANRLDLTLAGIVADPPASSHLTYSMIISYPSLTAEHTGGFSLDMWAMTASGYCYMALPAGVTPASVVPGLEAMVDKYHDDQDHTKRTYRLQPLKAIHFDDQYRDDAAHIATTALVMLGVLAVMILLMACINFINLSTALAAWRAKEMGVRKTLGAAGRQLVYYILSETLVITLVAVLIGVCVVEWVLPLISRLLDRKLTMALSVDPWLALFLVVVVVMVSLFSGLYPAVLASRFQPVTVLKSRFSGKGGAANLRKVLVVFQFMVAQALLIATLIISDQMHYFQSKPLGFDKEAIVSIPVPVGTPVEQEAFRQRLLNQPGIAEASLCMGSPVSESYVGTVFALTKNKHESLQEVQMKLCDLHYKEAFGLQLKAGRWFTEADERAEIDTTKSLKERTFVFVLNEEAVRTLGFTNPEDVLGQNIISGMYGITGEVVGVIEDFHLASFHEAITPVVMTHFPAFYQQIGLKIKPGYLSQTLPAIETQWKEKFPEYYYEYEFMDDHIANLYQDEARTFSLFQLMAGIAIFIGCLGLYGLISFIAQQKIKEVGIRKVLGASIPNIIFSFSKEFMLLIVIAFTIAAPAAWYAMTRWLDGFAYHVKISWPDFIIGLVVTVAIAFLTVGYRSIRAAIANPVEALKES